MRIIKKPTILACIALLATTSLFCQTATTAEFKPPKWDISLSNALQLKRMDNIQLEVSRKVMLTWLGVYFQATNDILVAPVSTNSKDANYLGKYGFMPQGKSVQFGGQIAWHLFRPERKFDLWIKWRAGADFSYRYNNPGTYWYWKEGEKVNYTISEKQTQRFGQPEMTFAMGLSRKIADKLSVFVEPAMNFQFFAQDYRANRDDVMIHAIFVARYGISYSF